MNASTSPSIKQVPIPTSTHPFGKNTSLPAPCTITQHSDSYQECTMQDRPFVARIHSPSHILLALRLLFTNPQRQRDLFTHWIHIPLGITSLLLLAWLIKLAMDKAPFRFPSPVLAMILLFLLLLTLDWLSSCAWVQRKFGRVTEGKVLLQPVLAVLEEPCDFCLRYMSVMFTPSFILIPAREVIEGKEIGLITGWFAASQILALIFPVLLHKAIRCIVRLIKTRTEMNKQRKEDMVKREQEQRRASLATLVAVLSTINPREVDRKRETDAVESKVVVEGGDKLGNVVTGLSGMTAIATAPLTVNSSDRLSVQEGTTKKLQPHQGQRQDAQRQLEHVQLETARQQGDALATTHTTVNENRQHYSLVHISPPHGHPTHSHPRSETAHDKGQAPEGRSRTRARSWIMNRTNSTKRKATSCPPHRQLSTINATINRTKSKIKNKSKSGSGSGIGFKGSIRPQSARATTTETHTPTESVMFTPTFDEDIFHTRSQLLDRQGSSSTCQSVREFSMDPHHQGERQSVEEGITLVMPTLAPPTPTRASQEIQTVNGHAEAGLRTNRKLSTADSEMTMSLEEKVQPSTYGSGLQDVEKTAVMITVDEPEQGRAALANENNVELDAINRLVEMLWNCIPWIVFSLVLIVGFPVFYIFDISLPLFLAVNLVTFLCSITIVPPKLRRYLHPILTTSIATVLLLWAIGAIRGWSLERTLESYSVDAKYTVLWNLDGYQGPVLGAGDVLFSTLDAGIVSLAIPMYRYRWDLWYHLGDMLVVLFPCSLLSLFVWPNVAANLGIEPERALAFTSRFMSTPLAIEMSLTIGADQSITVILVVITGILISIFKDPFFRLFKLDPTTDGRTQDNANQVKLASANDYLTIGIVMGSTAGAIGASSLISKPRSMAIASLSFVLFGAILLIFAAIPPIVTTLRKLANAPPQSPSES